MQQHFQEQMSPSIFIIPNNFVFVIEVNYESIFYFFMYLETFAFMFKLRLIHSAGLTVVNKNVVPSLFVCFCYMSSCSFPRETSLFCFPSSPDFSLDLVSGNIRTLGKTKLTVSLGTIH